MSDKGEVTVTGDGK